MDTNSIAQIADTAVPVAQTVYQRHAPAFTIAAMWLVRESHVWWPFLVSNGGLNGLFKMLINGKQQPPLDPAQPIKP